MPSRSIQLEKQAPERGTGYGIQAEAVRQSGCDRRLDRRYPLNSPLEYTAVIEGRQASGSGSTVNISSGGVLFQTTAALPCGLRIELSIAWPGDAAVKLHIVGVTVRTEDNCTGVSIVRYEYVRTAVAVQAN